MLSVDWVFTSHPGPIYGVLDGWGLRGVDGGGEEVGGGREAEKSQRPPQSGEGGGRDTRGGTLVGWCQRTLVFWSFGVRGHRWDWVEKLVERDTV